MSTTMYIDDHKQTVTALLRESEAFLEQIGSHEYAGQVQAVRLEVEQRKAPVIMFYGLYNAGKSTLINALCREEIAATGDVPTTAVIQTVPWEGYTLIDTPGIDAHTEHTEIAEQEILQSDVILFVMDNADTFDNAVVYQAIIDILKLGKPLAIIINQKNVDEDEDPNISVPEQKSILRIMGKVSSNLEVQGARNSMKIAGAQKNFLGIFPVNALTAFFAAGMEPLHTVSGISSLCGAINQSIRQSERVYMLQTPLINLRDILQKAINAYQDTSIYGEKQLLAENRNALLASRQRLHDRLLADGLRKIEVALEQVKSAAASGQPVEDVSQKLGEELNALLQEAAGQEQEALRSELKMEAMPGYAGAEISQEQRVPDTSENTTEWIAASGLIIETIPPIIIGPIPIPLNILAAIAVGVIGILMGKNKKDDKAAQQASQQIK